MIRFGRIPFKIAKLVIKDEDVARNNKSTIGEHSVSVDDLAMAPHI